MAIAVDTSGTQGSHNSGSTSLTYAFNNAAGDLLVVAVFNVSADGTPTVTYNGVSMTMVDRQTFGSGANRAICLFILSSPATGSHNVVCSQTGSSFLYSTAASYSGTSTSGQPDSSGKNSGSSITSLTTSTTVIASNCWLVCVTAGDNGNNPAAGTGTTLRSTIAADQYVGVLDSNATVSTGSQSLVSTMPVSQAIGTVIVSIKPPGAAGPSYRRLSLLGVGQ